MHWGFSMHRDAWNFQVEYTCITSADVSLGRVHTVFWV